MKVDLNKYSEFVKAVTSKQSNNHHDFVDRLYQLEAENKDVNIPLLLTAAIGLAAESGEFNEIPKKIVFQGKPMTEEARFHMKRELGDIFWYWTNACRALGYSPDEVITENVDKLVTRYPGGVFDVHYSENRKAGDL